MAAPVGAPVAAEVIQEDGVLQAPQRIAAAVVVDLVDYPKHPRSAPAEGGHLGHEWQPIVAARGVQGISDLLERADFHDIARQEPGPTNHGPQQSEE